MVSNRKGDPAMTKTLSLLLAATALSAAIAVPAWSAMRAGMPGLAQTAPQLTLVDDDEKDDDHEYAGSTGKRDHDDDDEKDDDDDEDDDDCEDDDGESCSGSMNPAPAGKVSPPQNGLFGNGEPPRVQVN
jgi:hypothetical protein